MGQVAASRDPGGLDRASAGQLTHLTVPRLLGYPPNPLHGCLYAAGNGPTGPWAVQDPIAATDDMNLNGLLLVLLGLLPVLIGRGGFRGVPVASR
jgi:hypothetical protein